MLSCPRQLQPLSYQSWTTSTSKPANPKRPLWFLWQDLNNLKLSPNNPSLHFDLSWTTSSTILDNLEQILLLFNFVLNNTTSYLESSLFSAQRYLVSVPTTRYLLLPSGAEQSQPQIRTIAHIPCGAKFPISWVPENWSFHSGWGLEALNALDLSLHVE